MADITLKRPNTLELAPAGGPRDIMQPYIEQLVLNPDQVLFNRGGGDMAIYEELLRDDQVRSCWQQRRQALTSKETLVEPGGSRAIDKVASQAFEENLQRLEWDRITDRMMYGIFYGYGVGEVLWQSDGRFWSIANIQARRAKRFAFGPQGQLYLLTLANPQGELMPDRKFWTFNAGADNDDNPYGVGLANALYWPVFFKRNDIKYWLIFLEKFGMPTSAGRMPPAMFEDPAQRDKVKAALKAIQADSVVVIPDNVSIELIEAARGGTADYATLHEQMNGAISKIILSQTMTTDDGSSRSQASVHKDVRDEIIKGDADVLCGSFNRQVVRWWTAFNFPGAKPPRVWRKTQEDEDLNTIAERDNKIYALGFEPTEDYIRDTYGEGWIKRQINPFVLNQPPAPQEFAEAAKMGDERAQNRLDQQSLIDGAERLARNYQEILGPRIESLLAYLEDTQDLVTFREHLNELLQEPPPAPAVEQIQRAATVSRLMGMTRGNQ
jgi:phage gp29-like protein